MSIIDFNYMLITFSILNILCYFFLPLDRGERKIL